MRRTWPLLMAALVALFFAQGQRAFFASLFVLTGDALTPTLRVGPAALALLPLLALLAPLLPLARWLDRHSAVAAAAVGAALFRLPMGHALETRVVGGALVVACGAMFVKWAVGLVGRRALGAGVVLGLVVDQLLRLAGSGLDPSLRPGWLPVQALLSLALIAVVVLWLRDPARREGRNELERRSGGLRLRGGLALGALFFLDLHLLGVPAVVARWTGTGHALAGSLVGLASAAAVGSALLLPRPTGGRTATLLLTGLVTAAALLGYWLEGGAVAAAMAAGHLAALLLVTRALEPASGRRSGVPVTAGLLLFVVLTALYDMTLRPGSPIPWLGGAVPWIVIAAGVLLAGCFILLPRPESLPDPGGPLPAALVTAGIAAAALVLALSADRDTAADTAGAGREGRGDAPGRVVGVPLSENGGGRHLAHIRSANTFQRAR